MELYGDGAYESRKNIAGVVCAKRGVRTIIRVNITSNTGGKVHEDARFDLIRDQLGTRSEDGGIRQQPDRGGEARKPEGMNEACGVRQRWRVESVFSSLKRI